MLVSMVGPFVRGAGRTRFMTFTSKGFFASAAVAFVAPV